MSIMMYMLRHMQHHSICAPKPVQLIGNYYVRKVTMYINFSISDILTRTSSSEDKGIISNRLAEFKKKLAETPFPGDTPPTGRQITPIKKLNQKTMQHPKQFEYPAWPDNTNPHTGEIGGPKGPEPTRYGDWERKGRCTDF